MSACTLHLFNAERATCHTMSRREKQLLAPAAAFDAVFLSLQLFQAEGLGALNHTTTPQKRWTCSASQQRQPALGWAAPEHRRAQPTRPQARFVLWSLVEVGGGGGVNLKLPDLS